MALNRKSNKEYMKVYMWYTRNIWKDKSKHPTVNFKKFYHFINKNQKKYQKES